MVHVFQIADILIEHALASHEGDVAIIAYYGSHAKGLASPSSDLDIFYIPEPGKARSLCSQFIIDGLPYDFWPVSWQMAENIANANSDREWAVSASLIADARVLYHRSKADLDRFNALKARIEELTQPQQRPAMVDRALGQFKNTLFQLEQMRLAATAGDEAGLHWAGWKFVNSAANCLALTNQTYFAKGWGANWREILQLQIRPEALEELMRAIVTPQDTDAMLPAAERLAQEVRGILLATQGSLAGNTVAKDVFADFYFFVFEYRHKILGACQRNDLIAAGFAAFQLQEEICQFMNMVASGFQGTDFNLLGEYSEGYAMAGLPDLLTPATQGDLAALAGQVEALDDRIRQWFEEHDIALNIMNNQAELRSFLERRDPKPKTDP